MVFPDNSFSIGRTPLVRLNRVTGGSPATILGKVEGRNPAYSVKCRIGASMIWDAERRGILRPGKELVEPTSGNTGIALAFVAAARGYKITLLMPETMSMERRKVLRALGAKLILTDGSLGMGASIERAEQMVASDPDHYVLLQQFQNPANPEIHRRTTALEILDATDGRLDAFVAGVGTGGTITGVGEVLKEKLPAVRVIAVEPAKSAVLSGGPFRPHGIQGIGASFIPGVLNRSIIDRIVPVRDEDATAWSRRLSREEGILAGISSGAAAFAACQVAAELTPRQTVVTILPDTGERYLSLG